MQKIKKRKRDTIIRETNKKAKYLIKLTYNIKLSFDSYCGPWQVE